MATSLALGVGFHPARCPLEMDEVGLVALGHCVLSACYATGHEVLCTPSADSLCTCFAAGAFGGAGQLGAGGMGFNNDDMAVRLQQQTMQMQQVGHNRFCAQ